MNQGEIWLIDLDPAVGAEMNKTRLALKKFTITKI
jgi:mRNA-degrading endonuclease toxin of MazEF toxin-antitoxin module